LKATITDFEGSPQVASGGQFLVDFITKVSNSFPKPINVDTGDVQKYVTALGPSGKLAELISY
jgi:hypothetical protein